MDAGEYVPDSVTNSMVRDRLAQEDCKPGFLLDGYPRTIEQVGELDSMLSAAGAKLDKAIELTVDVDEVVERLVKRAAEQGRADDTEDALRQRLMEYYKKTSPLIGYYYAKDALSSVDGLAEMDAVSTAIASLLDKA
jgi:adenylate kinase